MQNEIQKRKTGIAIFAALCFAAAIPNCFLLTYYVEIIRYPLQFFSTFIRRIFSILLFYDEDDIYLLLFFFTAVALLIAMIAMLIRKPVFVGISFTLLAFTLPLYSVRDFFRQMNITGNSKLFDVHFFKYYFVSFQGAIILIGSALIFLAFVLAALMCFFDKGALKKAQKLWFIPPVILLLGYLCLSTRYSKSIWVFITEFSSVIRYGRQELLWFFASILLSLIFAVLCLAGLLLACLWLNSGRKKVADNPAPQVKTPAKPNIPVQRNEAPDNAPPKAPYRVTDAPQAVEGDDMNFDEKLTRLKKLLDDGVITEEEFAAKKKQILGL